MARPKFTPDANQRRTLDALAKEVAELAAHQTTINARMDKLIATAAEQEIPIAVIAATAGRQRKTIYRHLGHRM